MTSTASCGSVQSWALREAGQREGWEGCPGEPPGACHSALCCSQRLLLGPQRHGREGSTTHAGCARVSPPPPLSHHLAPAVTRSHNISECFSCQEELPPSHSCSDHVASSAHSHFLSVKEVKWAEGSDWVFPPLGPCWQLCGDSGVCCVWLCLQPHVCLCFALGIWKGPQPSVIS